MANRASGFGRVRKDGQEKEKKAMGMFGHLPARDAQGVQDNRVIRLLREDALRAHCRL
jgi:hypothetical protein